MSLGGGAMPPYLLDEIAKHLSRADLDRLTTCSKRLHSAIQPIHHACRTVDRLLALRAEAIAAIDNYRENIVARQGRFLKLVEDDHLQPRRISSNLLAAFIRYGNEDAQQATTIKQRMEELKVEINDDDAIYKELRTKLTESCELAKQAPELNELLDTLVDINKRLAQQLEAREAT